AGVVSPDAAITLAGVRGREMAAACALEPTGMAAVMGGDPDEVVAAIESAGLYPANRNGSGQIVAAGAVDALAKFAAAPPAGTLAGLAKRALRGVEILTVNTPDDLAAARDLVARHGMAPSAEPTPQFRVVVAGAAGTFAPAADLEEGAEIRSGQTIGQVNTRQ